MPPSERLIAWCKQERQDLRDRIKAMEEERFRVFEKTLGRPHQRDVTADTIKDCHRKISELDEIVLKYAMT